MEYVFFFSSKTPLQNVLLVSHLNKVYLVLTRHTWEKNLLSKIFLISISILKTFFLTFKVSNPEMI